MRMTDFLQHSDLVNWVLAVMLLVLSVLSWVVMAWKWRLLSRVRHDVPRSVAVFWQSPGFDEARQRVAQFDRDACVLPLLEATLLPLGGTLASCGDRHEQLTRVLRNAMQSVLRRLQWGQIVLATAGSISPFIGLLGTVWGIFNAMTGMAAGGTVRIEDIVGPVGEALVMTAAGLAVAIPAVLGYNFLGRRIAQIEIELEGFAHDVRALLASSRG